MSVVLPTPESNPGKAEWAEVYANDKALKEAHEALEAEFKAAVKPVTWYTPKVIATEQSITTTTFKLMSENGAGGTADEIKEVKLPENGLILLGYNAAWQSSVSGAGRAAIFLNNNQVKFDGQASGTPVVQEAEAAAGNVAHLMAAGGGLRNSGNFGWSDVTTGQILGAASSINNGPFMGIFAAAGTYSVSVRFKAASGSVMARERKLWVCVLGT